MNDTSCVPILPQPTVLTNPSEIKEFRERLENALITGGLSVEEMIEAIWTDDERAHAHDLSIGGDVLWRFPHDFKGLIDDPLAFIRSYPAARVFQIYMADKRTFKILFPTPAAAKEFADEYFVRWGSAQHVGALLHAGIPRQHVLALVCQRFESVTPERGKTDCIVETIKNWPQCDFHKFPGEWLVPLFEVALRKHPEIGLIYPDYIGAGLGSGENARQLIEHAVQSLDDVESLTISQLRSLEIKTQWQIVHNVRRRAGAKAPLLWLWALRSHAATPNEAVAIDELLDRETDLVGLYRTACMRWADFPPNVKEYLERRLAKAGCAVGTVEKITKVEGDEGGPPIFEAIVVVGEAIFLYNMRQLTEKSPRHGDRVIFRRTVAAFRTKDLAIHYTVFRKI